MRCPCTPHHPRRKHRRAPRAGEIADPRGCIVRLSPAPRHLGQEILKGGGASASRARATVGGIRARGKKAHGMDVLALAQGTLDSGARCTFLSSPCCAPRGECAPIVGREGGWSRRPHRRRGFECHVRAHRGALPYKDEARDGLCGPTRESRHEVGPSVTRVRMIQRSSVAGSRVGGRDDGGAVRGDGAVGVGTLVDRGKVSDLERLGKRLSVVCAHASDGGRIGALRGNLKKLKRGAVGGTAREVRLVSDAEGMGAQARDASRAIGSQPFPPLDGEGGFDAIDRASRPPDRCDPGMAQQRHGRPAGLGRVHV